MRVAVTYIIVAISAAAADEREPETHALFTGPVQACILANTTLYLVQSNEVLKAPVGMHAWEPCGALPLQAGETIRSTCAQPGSSSMLFVLTAERLLASKDGGASWSSRRLGAQIRAYNDLMVFPDNENRIMVATTDGVWLTIDGGATLTRVFARVNEDENNVMAIAGDMKLGQLFFATRGGLFVSSDGGRTVSRVWGLPEGTVTKMALSPVHSGTLAFVCKGRLFYTETSFKSFRLVSSIYDFSECQGMAITSNGRDVLWSYPGGALWGKDWLAQSRAADSSGPAVAAATATQQPAVVTGTTTQRLEAAVQSAADAILQQEAREIRYRQVMQRIQMEPGARETVDAAIEYAQLHPDRIRKWLRDLNRSSWMPEVRLAGKRELIDDQIEGIDAVGTLDDAAYHGRKIGDESSSVAGEIAMSWDLEKIFFNPQELSIDDRRNRQTELRTDVANTMTIYYFERRNTLFKKLFDPPADYVELSKLEFKIEELTTKIDTLSGGYFTRALGERLGRAKDSTTNQPAKAVGAPPAAGTNQAAQAR